MRIWLKSLTKRRSLFNFAIPSVLVVILFALASTPTYADTASSSYDASWESQKPITIDNTEGVVDLNKGDKGDKDDDGAEAAAEAAEVEAEAAAEAAEVEAEAAAEAAEAEAEAAAEAADGDEGNTGGDDEGNTDVPTNIVSEPVWSLPTPLPSSGGGAVASIENDEVIQSTDIDIPSETPTAIINSPEEFPESITETSADEELVLDEGDKIVNVNSQALQRLELSLLVATTVIDAFPVLAQNAPLYIEESLATLQEWAEVLLQQFSQEMKQQVDKLLQDVGAALINVAGLAKLAPAFFS